MTDERPWRGRRLHFVGIGGAGMSGLALVAAQLELEEPPVPGERLVDVADLERHVVDPDCARHADGG